MCECWYENCCLITMITSMFGLFCCASSCRPQEKRDGYVVLEE